MRSFVMRFPNGKPKAMTFSYDDGIVEDLRLAELMRKYGVKCTFNINTMFYENGEEPNNRLTLAQIKELANDPLFEVACHGHIHPFYTYMPQVSATDDIIKNRKNLEQIQAV